MDKIKRNELKKDFLKNAKIRDGDVRKIVESYEKANEIEPLTGHEWNMIGVECYCHPVYNKELGVECFRKSAELNNERGMINLGKFLEECGDTTTAKELFERALEKKENCVDAIYELGMIYDKGNDIKKAKEFYKKCLQFKSSLEEYQLCNIRNGLKNLKKIKRKEMKKKLRDLETRIDYLEHQIFKKTYNLL
jgi:tetratricopeptide (TPR) repeat protein